VPRPSSSISSRELAFAQFLAGISGAWALSSLADPGSRRRAAPAKRVGMRSSGRFLRTRATRFIACSRVCLTLILDQVAHDVVDVAPDIADLGELRRLGP